MSLVLLACLPSGLRAGAPKRPPNILVLIADDLGWRDVGYHGSEVRTPHLDKLARAGVRLERHYVCPTCSPTRAGLLTGRNPSRFRIHCPIGDRSRQALPADVMNLAKLLRGRGYDTALVGKWHLGLRPEVGPRKYGFAHSYGYLHGQVDPYTHIYKNGDRTWHRDDVFTVERGHATDLIAAEAVKFVSAKRKGPFFLWAAFSVPHYPLAEAERWRAPYKDIKDPWRRLFAASVTHMDAAIGQIVAALEKAGQLDDTLILFTSDNGGQRNWVPKTEYGRRYAAHTTLGDNRPWRGWKGQLYEGGIRVPAFAYWRGRLKPRVVRETVSYLDWLPTFAGLAGARTQPEWGLEGRDVWPLLTGAGKVAAPTLYWNTGNARAVLAGEWKLIVSGRKRTEELYDLAADPAEARNVALTEPGRLARLRKVLAEQVKRDPK
jgi:arylsulfatase A-like enzyme